MVHYWRQMLSNSGQLGLDREYNDERVPFSQISQLPLHALRTHEAIFRLCLLLLYLLLSSVLQTFSCLVGGVLPFAGVTWIE